MTIALWILMAAAALGAGPAQTSTAPLTVASPDGAIVVKVGTGDQLTWAVSAGGREILRPSAIGLSLEGGSVGGGGRVLGAGPVITGTSTRSVDDVLRPVVRVKRAEIRDRFNERSSSNPGEKNNEINFPGLKFTDKIEGDAVLAERNFAHRWCDDSLPSVAPDQFPHLLRPPTFKRYYSKPLKAGIRVRYHKEVRFTLRSPVSVRFTTEWN